DLCLAQAVHHGSYRWRLDAADVADDVSRRHLREVAADAQHEGRVRRDGGFAAEGEVQQRETDDGDEERDAEQREQDGKTTASHRCRSSPEYSGPASCRHGGSRTALEGRGAGARSVRSAIPVPIAVADSATRPVALACF